MCKTKIAALLFLDQNSSLVTCSNSNSSATDPGCHGNDFWVRIGYNSACMRDMSKILASNREFSGSGY